MNLLRAPEVATPRAMAAMVAAFYLVGGVAGLLLTWGGHGQGTARTVMVGMSLSALLSALVVARWGSRWDRNVFHLPIGSAALLVDIAVLLAPDAGTAVAAAALVAFTVMDAVLLFTLYVAAAHVLVGLAGVTIALTVQGDVSLATALALDSVIVALAVATRVLVLRAADAGRDPLTGLANRRGFDEALQHLLADLSRSREPLSAALLDLDHFKAINDTRGHEAGDQVLRRVADEWTRALPPRAVLARHGGDEFALLLPGFAGPAALELLRRLCADHSAVRLSVGVAERRVGDGAAQLMRRADQALYAAKAAGRGRCELDSEGVADPDQELARDLASALAFGELAVHLQPIVELCSGTVVGVEALARWTHSRRGPVAPDVFIAVAERHGLIGALGEQVLTAACTQLAALHRDTGRRLRLGVNVSGLQLSDPGYPARVAAVLAETGWPAGEVVLEVTESLLEADSAVAVAALHTLRALGIRVALDDFGTGYSSFSRLDTLPVDVLKVDSSFIATTTSSVRRAQMLRSIVDLAQALGMDVVAEGVETAEHDALLRGIGCTFGQGWLYGRPMPLAQLASTLAARPLVKAG
ncbi:bifunctional diguanylate cyclase/phosphodiesterase [Modestobacter sp. VKM Ac-2986]|uniref:putative bifunctional diguanylate cyclase/phosphodiesterase n=1 Tax=Modestobacter sp. VKM Ac-2986 TaxID=3004140 RepID=UPI0022AB58AE|nr:bifunctional diguanylate cyclase/phosphodiesterase [Modestobacter sp. VKM Ac-2986]MCZ2830762.1 bifunctional diguanylate cyclase/phosphodiesterase [Modestobacter sp. VKM Ac-2986]